MASVKCKTCGADMPGTSKFCGSCGTPLPLAAPLAPGKLNIKRYAKPVLAAAVILFLMIAAMALIGSAPYAQPKGDIFIYNNVFNANGGVFIIPSGKNKTEIDGYVLKSEKSLDGTKAVALISEKPESHHDAEEGCDLYLITNKVQLIAEDVYNFWLSASGNGVVFTKEYEKANKIAELWLYSGGKTTKITNNFASESYYTTRDYCAISPNGKTLAYVSDDDGTLKAIVWDGKEKELGKDIKPMAVSDGARHVYYTKNDTLYVQKALDKDTRVKLGDNVLSIVANRDLSQVLFTANPDTTPKAYISINGEERKPISGGIGLPILPLNTHAILTSKAYVCGIPGFADTFYPYLFSDGAVGRINAQYETDRILKNAESVFLAEDGKTLNFLKEEKLYRLDGKKVDAEAVKITDEKVKSYLPTTDGGAVYFLNEDGEIFYQKGKGKPVLVSDDFSPGSDITYTISTKNNMLYYISDRELYVSVRGTGKPVSGINGDVYNVYAGAFEVIAIVREDEETLFYRSTAGQKFSLVK